MTFTTNHNIAMQILPEIILSKSYKNIIKSDKNIICR